MTTDHHDHDAVTPNGTHRRSFLKGAGLVAGGAALGAGAYAFYEHVLEEPEQVISEDGVELRSGELRQTIELANSTNRGRGTQRIIWSVATDQKIMVLTFDDGPDPEFTPQIQEILRRFGIRANFNIMGYNAEHHTALLRAGVSDGHEIGNHTLTHKDLAFQTVAGIRRQLGEAKQKIDELSGQDTTLFRPPRGVITGDTADISAKLGYDVLLWTAIITKPPGTRPSVISEYAESRFGKGHILALHDGIGAGTFDRQAAFARDLAEKRRDEIKALPAILESALDAGYSFVTASELMAAGGIAPPGAHVPG